MLQLIPKTNIDFIGKRYVFFVISGALLLAGLGSLIIKKGPRFGLDFTGGTLVEVKFQKDMELQQVRKALSDKNVPSFEIQSVSGQPVYIIRTQLQTRSESALPAANDVGTQILTALTESFPDQNVMILRKEFVGPTVGRHLFRQTSYAFLLTFLGIIIYVAFRFHSGIWGVTGVIALIHDVFATIGLFSLLDKEITVTVVAALLTIAGYSINDTIVVFDYMRERMRLRKMEPLTEIINRSINDTLSRTVITNLTTFTVVLILYFFGGEVIHDFATAMVFGAIVGTYSSIAIAAPLVYEWGLIQSKDKQKK
jgi:preprotein translocase subunit SecF